MISKQEDSFEAEFSVAKVEEVLKAGAKEVHDQHIVVALLSIPAYVGYPYTSLKGKYDLLSSVNVIQRAKGQKTRN